MAQSLLKASHKSISYNTDSDELLTSNVNLGNNPWLAGNDDYSLSGNVGYNFTHNSDMLTVQDVITLDTQSYAKGGNGGGKGGGGGGDNGILSKYISGGDAATSYNIEINFKGTWTVDLQQDFIDSADFLSTVIIGDVSDVFFRGKIIDDIRIDATLKEIDGEGGILGQAGATAVRTADILPATAIMEFDIADAANFDAVGLWDDIVLHEMIHSIGFSAGIWDMMGGLITGAGTDNPLFTGENATQAYEDLFAVVDAAGVPLEQDGGAGTRDSHWDEETFDNELMTGYINNGNYLSDMTIAALDDMGYDTIYI